MGSKWVGVGVGFLDIYFVVVSVGGVEVGFFDYKILD